MPKYGFKYYKENNYVPKHITVDIGKQTTAKTGAVLSSRQVIDVVDEKGEKVRGFFTENETVNANDLFMSRTKQIKPPKGYEALSDTAQKISDSCSRSRDGMRKFIAKIYSLTKLDFSEKLTPEQQAEYEKKIPDIKKMLTDKCGVSGEALADFGQNEKVNEFVKSVLGAAFSAYSLESAHTEHQLQQKDTNINRRNNAMSDYAQMLGIPDTVAKSTSMTVINGDNIMHGSFMVNAQGISYEQLMNETNTTGMNDLSLTPSAYREISNMQVLDFLCGNIDRHAANLFYKLAPADPNDPYSLKIVGVQGIDNDASFGKIDRNVSSKGKLYDRMSLARDIKIMDKALADKIKSLRFEDLESKLRLAGLSGEEISAAGERFAMLRERLDNKDITLVENNEEWTLVATDRRMKASIRTKDENVAFMGQNLPNNHPFKYMSNIFAMTEGMVNHYNAYIPGKKRAAPKNVSDPLKGKVPTGSALNIVDSFALSDHADGLTHIKNEYAALCAGKNPDEAFAPITRQLDSVIDLMRRYGKKDTLSDNERNLLSQELKELHDAAEEYTKGKPAQYENAEYHAAKNISAYTAFAREAVRRDALEAEMNLASKGADDIRKAHGIAPTGITYERLEAKVNSIGGRCTDFFTDMMTSFAALKDIPASMSGKNKTAIFNQAITAAKAYIRHKTPNGSMDGLKKKEKDRVNFAKELIEYADAQKVLIREKAEKAKQTKQERDDYFSVAALHAKCQKLADDYKHADTPEKKSAAADAVLLAKKDFAKDYEAVLAVSDKYSPGHDMQAACGTMLSGGIADFMKVYLVCSNSRTSGNETDAYAALGMDESMKEKADNIIENGKKILDGYKQKKAASVSKAAEENQENREIIREVPGLN